MQVAEPDRPAVAQLVSVGAEEVSPSRAISLNRTRAVLNGALFGIVLPATLVLWARATADVVRIPPVASPPLGLSVALTGAILLLIGIAPLRIYNGWRQTRYVAQDVFRLLPHPIYTGFCMICAGISIAAGSASGLWLITPIMVLSCAALVLGYERQALRDRFGTASARLIPRAGTSAPTGMDRLSFYVFVLVPWLVLYEAVLAIGTPPDAISGVSPFEQRLPVLEWWQIAYGSTYFLTLLAPVFARTRSDLRWYSVRGLWTMLIAYPAYLLIPLISPKRPFVPHTVPGHLLLWERSLDSPVAAFPSFHVIWSMLAAEVFARRWPRLRGLFYGWAILVAASCVATSQHSLLDVLGGAATVALVVRAPQLCDAVQRQAERIANARQQWAYAGAAAFFGLGIAGTMAGPKAQMATLVAASAAAAGAVLRPCRFFGGLALGTAAVLAAPLFGTDSWLVLAALSMGSSWAQAMNHGSRREWTAVPLHPTPVYSIVYNGVTALAVTRLWVLGAPLHVIAGIYFILTGLGRFVEEAWRGEGETPVFRRLRLYRYQWAAIASVICGALMTACGNSAPAPAPRFALGTLLPAALFGLAVAMATGIELPSHHRRFHSQNVDARNP